MITIADIQNLEDKSYVNGVVTGRVSSTKKINDTMWAGKIGDDNDTIDLVSFNHDIRSLDGKTVSLSGKGMRKDTRNGYVKLSMNENTKVTVEGGTQMAGLNNAEPVASKPVQQTGDAYRSQTLCYCIQPASDWARNEPENDGVLKPAVVAGYMVELYKAKQLAESMMDGEDL